jgi:hypothetical protein
MAALKMYFVCSGIGVSPFQAASDACPMAVTPTSSRTLSQDATPHQHGAGRAAVAHGGRNPASFRFASLGDHVTLVFVVGFSP